MANTATYKGRKYALKWVGKTKHGERAHLAFFDDSKSFWVDASAVTISESPTEKVYGKGRGGRVAKCRECGGWKAPGDTCNEPCEF